MRGVSQKQLFDPCAILADITAHITLYPGDVVTLGRTAQRVAIPVDAQNVSITASVDGLGTVATTVT